MAQRTESVKRAAPPARSPTVAAPAPAVAPDVAPPRYGYGFAGMAVHGCAAHAGPEVRQALAGRGVPLDPGVRETLEHRLGADFTGVRVHEGPAADRSTRALDALAYTVGQHVVFRAGRYAPHTDEGRLLLAHELGHVRDGASAPGVVLRQPANAPVTAPVTAPAQAAPAAPTLTPATPADQRDFVEMAIGFMTSAADFFAAARVAPARVGTILAGYLATRDNSANIIATSLAGDPALTDRLRVAYRAAVTAILAAGAREGRRLNADTQTAESPHELFLRHRQLIHEWAWPEGAPAPGRNRLLDAVPLAERQRIRVVAPYTFTPANLDGHFHPRAIHLAPPANTTVTVDPVENARIRAGLASVAGGIATQAVSPFMPDTTTSMSLDLGRYGGVRAIYRFTHVRHANGRGELLVERVATLGADERRAAQQGDPSATFARHNFVAAPAVPGTSIDWSADQLARLHEAVSRIPESMLASAQGIRFIRVPGLNPSDPTTDASYSIQEHAINVYDSAFTGAPAGTMATPGGRPSSDFDRLIAHEVGHALDRAPVRPLQTQLDASIARQRRFTTRPAPGRPGRVILPPNQVAGWEALQARIRRERAALEAGRTLSGSRYAADATGALAMTEQLPAGELNDFRTAMAADGQVRVTTYSDRGIEEYFAESFSYYVTDPELLARLRPAIYAYFAARFPDAARPGPPAPAPAPTP